jgi:branched-chain amino acid transport system ATP-binding protein
VTVLLTIENVYTAYDKADVLMDVSLQVREGEITCILGSNGSGKSTLIRSILGLTPARKGRIMFDGIDLTRMPAHKVIATGITCIPEGRKVFPKMTVDENLRLRRVPGNRQEGNQPGRPPKFPHPWPPQTPPPELIGRGL